LFERRGVERIDDHASSLDTVDGLGDDLLGRRLLCRRATDGREGGYRYQAERGNNAD
jgi:hypothetical protein